MANRGGFEPPTKRFGVSCSAVRATDPHPYNIFPFVHPLSSYAISQTAPRPDDPRLSADALIRGHLFFQTRVRIWH